MKKLAIVMVGALMFGGFVFAQGENDGASAQTSGPSEAKELTGAGASFPAVLYSKWFSEYYKLTGVQVNYQAIGSGGGIKSISDMTVDFGATDGIMTDEQLAAAKGGEIVHIPTTIGAVVPTYNIPELANSQETLKFTPETISGIFLGEIKTWNDPKLVADNPSLKTISKDIVVAHRSDGSGTTNIFTSYLKAVSESWAQKVGAGNSVQWPVGLGGKGNEGVAGVVKQTPYSIGYVELAYANQNKLPAGQVKNKSGKFITPNMKTASLAAQGVTLPDDMKVMLVNSSNPDAFPIVGFTWLLVYTKQTDAAKAPALARMLWWAIHDGQQYCEALDYAPLPADAVKKAEVLIKKITINGKQALPANLSK
ncbi:MAG: phosphate ABC transporter substrate-binding protein PstS [Treponema sp.]|nr:phosphate ABC transporter substrate-binding protein PstS [Treponema sp.]